MKRSKKRHTCCLLTSAKAKRCLNRKCRQSILVIGALERGYDSARQAIAVALTSLRLAPSRAVCILIRRPFCARPVAIGVGIPFRLSLVRLMVEGSLFLGKVLVVSVVLDQKSIGEAFLLLYND